MFGRATIRLGIGPHSSIGYIVVATLMGALLSLAPRKLHSSLIIDIVLSHSRIASAYTHTCAFAS